MEKDIFLSINRAILGNAIKVLRAIAFAWNEKEIIIDYIVDRDLTEDEIDEIETISTEVVADFWESHSVVTKVTVSDESCLLQKESNYFWAYDRNQEIKMTTS